jgi:acetyl esterase
MRNVAPLHPQAKSVLQTIAELEQGVVPPVPVAQMRSLMKARTARLAADPPVVGRIENRIIEGAGGSIPIRIYRPDAPSGELLPALVYFHGGGFVVGDLDMVETVCRTICRDAGIVVVSVDYRLAPEHPYPAGLEDAITATRWVVEQSATLGVAADRIAIGGDSAGGNLAAAASQALLHKDGISLKFQVLVYPVTDLTCSQQSYIDLGTGYPLTTDRMRFYISLYLKQPADAATPGASPLLASSFAGLPPALVIVAGLDPLVDEGIAYANSLRAAGIEAESVEVPDHPHGFLGWTRDTDAARNALSLIGERLRQRLRA